MQKKYKRALIVGIVSLAVLTLILVLVGLAQVSLDQYGLNYNKITANYDDTTVYGPGLHYIGISNTFIKVKKNQQSISYQNLTTYTTDFYSLGSTLEVSYLLNFSTSDPFTTVKTFYETMGESFDDIMRPLIQNQILIILSSHNSSYYQNTNLANTQLQAAMATKIQTVVSQWIGVTINVIIQSLVCQGTTTNTQTIDREIQSLLHDIQRAENQKVELTGYFSNLYAKHQLQILSVEATINQKAADLQKVLTSLRGTNTNIVGLNISKFIYNNGPLKYNLNLVDILQELAIIGNRTFPY